MLVIDYLSYSGVQRINNVFHIVDKVENVCVNKYIFDLIDNVEYVVYALYSSIIMLIYVIFIKYYYNSHQNYFIFQISAPLNFPPPFVGSGFLIGQNYGVRSFTCDSQLLTSNHKNSQVSTKIHKLCRFLWIIVNSCDYLLILVKLVKLYL